MSSAYSTITSNVNLLLIDTKVITKNNPYVAYVSSVNIPGRIATIRDATGYLSTPNSIIVSTLKNVLFADGTSSFSITQPFGYITLSARDPNTWNIINTFAFPQPQGTTNVSSLYVNSGIIANSLVVNTFISTNYLNAYSISTINEKASTIFTSSLYANIVSTNILNAFSISTNQIKTSTIFTSTLTLNTAGSNGILSLSNDGKTLLINNIPSGNFTAISTATTNFNMNGFSISNVNTLNTSNISSVNISTGLITTSSVRGINILTSNVTVSNILNGNQLNISTLNTSTLNVGKYLNLFDNQNNTFLNPIIASNGNLMINNQLNTTPYYAITQGIVNNGVLNNCNNDITNVANLYFTDVTMPTNLIGPIYGSSNQLIFDIYGLLSYGNIELISSSIYLNDLSGNRGTFDLSNNSFYMSKGLVLNNTDLSGVNHAGIRNLNIYDVGTNKYLNSITASNSILKLPVGIDVSSNEIYNVLQTATINSAATNVIAPYYFTFKNNAGAVGYNLASNTWVQLLSNQPSFIFSSNFFNLGAGLVKFNFNFNCRVKHQPSDISNGVISFYYTLYNENTSIEISGNTFSDSYPITVIPFPSTRSNYSFSYEDIFNLSSNTTLGNIYHFNLYALQTQLDSGAYIQTDTHNITFQPIQPA